MFMRNFAKGFQLVKGFRLAKGSKLAKGLLLSALLCSPVYAQAEDETPQYGGDLNVITVYRTLSALSWDPADWVWKQNHDTGMVREQLIGADLKKSIKSGGSYPFVSDAYLPTDALRGELAKSWEFEDRPEEGLVLVFKLRQGVMFQELPGVMKAREMDAEDVVFSYNLVNDSPKLIATYFDHIKKVVAVDKYTVEFHFNEFFAEWAYRFGYGYYSAIVPRETANVDRKNWKNVVGTGPFRITDYIRGNSQIYAKNENYWGTDEINGKDYKIPFVDNLKYRIIMDEATSYTALRTGKVDILEGVRWIVIDHLKETTPELTWSKRLAETGTFIAFRLDQEPFNDVRVRRALNLAVNQQEIVDLYYGGHAELFAYPQHPTYGNYFQPLNKMPESIQELYSYNPERAKELLAEAGYAEGLAFRVQVCTCNPNHMDLIPLIEDYMKKVGVTMIIEPYEYASHLSLMTTRKHGEGYFMNNGHTNPTTTLRKSFGTGQTWNPSQYSDPEFDRKMKLVYNTRDEAKREQMVREMTRDIMEEVPYLFLPTGYAYSAWWPWVKNYGGELRAGAVHPGPIYARIWIDQKMKNAMGF